MVKASKEIGPKRQWWRDGDDNRQATKCVDQDNYGSGSMEKKRDVIIWGLTLDEQIKWLLIIKKNYIMHGITILEILEIA